MEPKYEEQFTAFIDFLGVEDVSKQTDDTTRLKILELLLSLSALRGEFDVQSAVQETGRMSGMRPAVSTFSDHIVVSYPLQPIYDAGSDERFAALTVLGHFTKLLTSIAAAALRIGFLVRGGATVGKLYHARGVVFGEALVEAYRIESRTSVYPRVVLSPKLTSRPLWAERQLGIVKDGDGLHYFNYFQMLLYRAAPPGESYGADVKAWFEEVVPLIARKLTELRNTGNLNALAKWGWFAREFRDGVRRMNPLSLKSFGVQPDAISF
jgi:hypothetical protein